MREATGPSLGRDDPTPENFKTHARALYGERAEGLLKVYPAETAAQAKRSAQDLAGDRFIGFPTWKWLEMQLKTGKAPVYRYRFEQTLPLAADAPAGSGSGGAARVGD